MSLDGVSLMLIGAILFVAVAIWDVAHAIDRYIDYLRERDR